MVDLSPKAHRTQIIVGIVTAALCFVALVAIPRFSTLPNQLERIRERGYLRVLTLHAPSTYYEDSEGANGFEYHLSQMFADFIGVELRIELVDQFADLYPELIFGDADLIAAGVSRQDDVNQKQLVYGPGYYRVTSQLLYKNGLQDNPANLDDLESGILEVIRGSSHSKLLKSLKKKNDRLSWHTNNDIGTEELIELVDDGLVDYILADSHEIALQRRFYPELRVGFELGEARQLRWATKSSADSSLIEAIRRFFEQIKKDGRLDQLIHRYYSQVEDFNYSDIQTFTAYAKERLPKYRELFQREARAHNMDWRLLAAIGYQESHWNPKAASPTGVRGIMMLTRSTAKQVKIKNRLNPEQSIQGGAKYFKRVLAKIPERINQPDRNWLALASYNVGFGHLEDARKITQMNAGDPDKWIDVKQSLPLLGQKKWYKKTKHGYARGWEPVKYVENIRKYYDLLVWMDEKQNPVPPPSSTRTTSEKLLIPPSF